MGKCDNTYGDGLVPELLQKLVALGNRKVMEIQHCGLPSYKIASDFLCRGVLDGEENTVSARKSSN